MSIDNILIQAGRHELNVNLAGPKLILIGGSEKTSVLAADSGTQPTVDFAGEKIELPHAPMILVNLPFTQLNPACISGDSAVYELLVYINGRTQAATHWKADSGWSQSGLMLPTYLGEHDLTDIAFEAPISGKGLNIVLQEAVPIVMPGTARVTYPSQITEQVIDLEFPNRWNNDVLSYPIKARSATTKYTVASTVVSKSECSRLVDMAEQAASYQELHGDRMTLDKIRHQTLPRIHAYASQYRH